MSASTGPTKNTICVCSTQAHSNLSTSSFVLNQRRLPPGSKTSENDFPKGRSVRLLHIQPHPVSGKSPHIRCLLDNLVSGLACSMSRSCLDPGKVGFVTNLCCLERSDVFEGVTWYDAIVGVGSGGEDRGIGLASLDVVIRRIVQEVTEIRFPCWRPKLVYPCFPARELVEAEHIHHTNLG